MDKKHLYELAAQEAMDIVRSYPEHEGGESEIAGLITDQDEALKFLQWLCSPEAQAIAEQIRGRLAQGEEL